jgi:hypothetical protein
MAARERRSNSARTGKDRRSSDVIEQDPQSGIDSAANDASPANLPDPSTDKVRRAEIALAAYYHAERRGFGGNRELDDWLQAEREVLEKNGPG